MMLPVKVNLNVAITIWNVSIREASAENILIVRQKTILN